MTTNRIANLQNGIQMGTTLHQETSSQKPRFCWFSKTGEIHFHESAAVISSSKKILVQQDPMMERVNIRTLDCTQTNCFTPLTTKKLSFGAQNQFSQLFNQYNDTVRYRNGRFPLNRITTMSCTFER